MALAETGSELPPAYHDFEGIRVYGVASFVMAEASKPVTASPEESSEVARPAWRSRHQDVVPFPAESTLANLLIDMEAS